MNEPTPKPLTYEEFLAYAESHEGRFEYVDGQVVDMGIPSDAHQDLAGRLLEMLNPHLRPSGCKVRLAGRLRTGKHGRFPERSPDLMVICDGKPRKLVCEIMSPNRGDDLGPKLTEYRAMAEFQEYLVVDSTRRWVRLHRRTETGDFAYDVDRIAGLVHLHSVDFTLDIDALYDEAGVT
jgi:Uma2 family endonuclease